MRPQFSILVPTYNQARYLPAALESLMSQSFREWEAIVVNDGSSDDTPIVMADYAGRDSRIKTCHKENGGVATALNTGLDYATGEWICWLSSDDLFEPDALEAFHHSIMQQPEYRFFHSEFYEMDELTGLRKPAPPNRHQYLPGRESRVIAFFHHNYVHGISIAIHRQVFDQVGMFNTGLRYAQDVDMWLRVSARFPFGHIDRRTCVTRLHTAAGTSAFPEAGPMEVARACLDFLNKNRFPVLFPALDLTLEGHQTAAAKMTLQAVFNLKADMYRGIGFVPALLERFREWLHIDCPGTARKRLLDRLAPIIAAYRPSLPARIQETLNSLTTDYKGSSIYRPHDFYRIMRERHAILFRERNAAEAACIERYMAKQADVPMVQRRLDSRKTQARHGREFVNIGMVTYNRLEFTRQAIAALVKNTDFPHVLTVVDNNSQDSTQAYLQEMKSQGVITNLVMLDENVGVAKASNLAWSLEPEALYYLKLDNDIVIQKPGWLKQMIDVIDRTPFLGALAYNFEPYSYPLQETGGCYLRLKKGNLGGACILIPRRTWERLGVWCEDYGLYSEEDADYGRRITSAGLINAYMEDEHIGLHLPAGRAAAIDAATFTAVDGVEEKMDSDYRQWKDEQRRKVIGSGLLRRNFTRYANDPSSLYIESRFAVHWLLNHRPAQEQKLKKSVGMCSSRLKVVVYTTDGRNEACPQIRSLLPCRALSDNMELLWGVTWRPETRSYDVDATLAAQADLVVITRFFPSPKTADFIDQLLAGSVPVVYDTDDLLTDIDPDNTFKSMGDDAAPYIIDLIRRAAMVTVANEELKRLYALFAQRIVVLPNMLDDSLWSNASIKTEGGPLIIGYAGGFTHRNDLRIIEEALLWIAKKYGDQVRFRFMGCATEALQLLPGFESIGGVASYKEFAGILRQAGFDIAIAPLRDTRFNRCKSNVKWLEYSACGFAGVYSDLPPYNASVEQGQTGLLAENTPHKWYSAIDLLISNPDLRRNIAANARRKVLTEQTPAIHAWRYLEAYRSVIEQKQIGYDANPRITENNSPASMQLISIVILTFNQLKYTQECLESIKNCTPESYEIIFVDNGSTDGTVEWQRELVQVSPHIRLVENSVNLGFAKGCNQGIRVATGSYIMLLNNDTVVTAGWLAGLQEVLDLYPDNGIVGPMTNSASGAQVVADPGYGTLDELPAWAAAFREKNRHRRIPRRRIVGFCMLFKRRLVDEIGVLDESFGTGNFEDDDFCLRAAVAGYRNFIAGDVFIHHFGSRSFIGNKIDYQSSISGNRKIFSSKWSRLDPKSRFGNKPLVINAIEQADSFNRKGQLDSAVSVLIEALQKVPKEKELSFRLAEILLEVKRFKDSNAILEELAPGDEGRKFALIGLCAEGLEQFDKADQNGELALSHEPSNVQALNLKGTLAYRKGDKEAAERFFKTAVDIDPGFGESHTNLGVMKWDSGKFTEAVDLFERGFILSAAAPEVVSAYHTAIVETETFARAEPFFREAAALFPDDKRISFLLIALLIQQEKFSQALLETERAMDKFGAEEGILSAALKIRERIEKK